VPATSRPRLVAASLLIALGGIGVLDALLIEGAPQVVAPTTPTTPITEVVKRDGVDVLAALTALGLEGIAQREQTLLEQVTPTGVALQYRVLLRGEERLGALTWLDHPSAKPTFQALKQALLQSLSAEVTDLRDDTLTESGRPTVNVLRFTDPKLSPDHLVILRVRERLYELHLTPTGRTTLEPLLRLLTERDA
jgi:hypothetical protein